MYNGVEDFLKDRIKQVYSLNDTIRFSQESPPPPFFCIVFLDHCFSSCLLVALYRTVHVSLIRLFMIVQTVGKPGRKKDAV